MTATVATAAKSDKHYSIAMIAGQKSHLVATRTLLEDATQQVEGRLRYSNGSYIREMKTVTLPAGTELFYGTACGTKRNAGTWKVYTNSYQPTEELTCTKCQAKQH